MAKSLVAYFSASGVTAEVANRLAKAINADVFEIVPEQLYTDADLDWTNVKSRSSVEMNNKGFRPAIAGVLPDVADYETIYLGFPIWWYVAPTIINTFLEGINTDGKRIALFATSGSSGMGNTKKELEISAPNAQWIGEKRFDSSVSEQELGSWANNL